MTKIIEVPDGFDARLSALADEVGASKNDLVQQLLENALEEIEDYYRARLIAERIKRGEDRAIPLEEVERRFGLAD